jgi:hypothetical protein
MGMTLYLYIPSERKNKISVISSGTAATSIKESADTGWRGLPVTGFSATMLIDISSNETGQFFGTTHMIPKNKAFDNDPEIAALTDSELMADINALFGAWEDREEITDDWLENMRRGWDDRLTDLYGPDKENLPS